MWCRTATSCTSDLMCSFLEALENLEYLESLENLEHLENLENLTSPTTKNNQYSYEHPFIHPLESRPAGTPNRTDRAALVFAMLACRTHGGILLRKEDIQRRTHTRRKVRAALHLLLHRHTGRRTPRPLRVLPARLFSHVRNRMV